MSYRLSEGGVVYVTRVVSASLGNVLTHTALCCPVMRACDAPCMSAGTSACLVCSPHRKCWCAIACLQVRLPGMLMSQLQNVES